MARQDKTDRRGSNGFRPPPALTAMLLFFSCGVVGLLGFLRVIEPPGKYVDLGQTQPSGDQVNGPDEPGRLRFAVATMVSAAETFSTYRRLVQLVGKRLGMEGAIVLKPSYAEVRKALENASIDVAFVCTGTYIHSRKEGKVDLLATPRFKGGRAYRCLILVPSSSKAQTLDDLRGAVFAFSDPESNTGCLIPRALLAQQGQRANKFFRKIVYTGSHDRSVQSVAAAIVDAGSVDSLVLESLVEREPELRDRVRILWESESCGPPPIVVPHSLDQDLRRRLAVIFLSLHRDEEGQQLLASIGIERFEEPQEQAYDSVRTFYEQVTQGESMP